LTISVEQAPVFRPKRTNGQRTDHRSRWGIGTASIFAVLLLGVATATAHRNDWAFPESQVRVREVGLRYSFNRLFPQFAPHEVNCKGLIPTRLKGGAPGFIHIRCRIETIVVPDFMYHLNARGRVVVTRH
jgi:hypothetical protein